MQAFPWPFCATIYDAVYKRGQAPYYKVPVPLTSLCRDRSPNGL